MELKTAISVVCGIVALIGATLGADQYFAKSDELKVVEERLDLKILEDRIHYLQRRVWAYDDQYGIGCTRCGNAERRNYRELIAELERLKAKLKAYGKV